MLKLHGTLPVLKSATRGSYLVTVTKKCVSGCIIEEHKGIIARSESKPNRL